MTLFLILWLADLCDNVGIAFIAIMFIGILAVIVTVMLAAEDVDEPIEETRRKVFVKYFKVKILC